MGGGGGEGEGEVGDGAPEVLPSRGEKGCLNGLFGVDEGEDVLENWIWELADSVAAVFFHFQSVSDQIGSIFFVINVPISFCFFLFYF